MFDPLSLHKACICENDAIMVYHHDSALSTKSTVTPLLTLGGQNV